MALFTESSVRQRAFAEVRKFGATKKADQLILESTRAYTPAKAYDIFLSHSIRDAELILGMKGVFEDLGYLVYVDWIEDPALDRSKVTSATADKLRQRMASCRSLFFVTTSNAEASKWMPWECGFFDGKKEKVAIAPVVNSSTNNGYSGQEYLGLYPYVVKQPNTQQKETLWIRKSDSVYLDYDTWVKTAHASVVWKNG